MAREDGGRPRRALTTEAVKAKNAALDAGDPYLVLRAANDEHLQVFRLSADRPRVSIGRGKACDVQLPWDDRASGGHALLEWIAGEWMVEDVGSTNGSFVNRQRVSGHVRLNDGDRLRFGTTDVAYYHRRFEELEGTHKGGVEREIVLSPLQRETLIPLCRPLYKDPDCTELPSNKAIGDRLSRPEETVKARFTALYKRFGIEGSDANKRRQLARKVLDDGYLTGRDF